MSTISNLETRVERLEDENGGGDGTEIVITFHRVGSDGDSEPVEENRIWEDESGQWHSETTELTDKVDPEDHGWSVQ